MQGMKDVLVRENHSGEIFSVTKVDHNGYFVLLAETRATLYFKNTDVTIITGQNEIYKAREEIKI